MDFLDIDQSNIRTLCAYWGGDIDDVTCSKSLYLDHIPEEERNIYLKGLIQYIHDEQRRIEARKAKEVESIQTSKQVNFSDKVIGGNNGCDEDFNFIQNKTKDKDKN